MCCSPIATAAFGPVLSETGGTFPASIADVSIHGIKRWLSFRRWRGVFALARAKWASIICVSGSRCRRSGGEAPEACRSSGGQCLIVGSQGSCSFDGPLGGISTTWQTAASTAAEAGFPLVMSNLDVIRRIGSSIWVRRRCAGGAAVATGTPLEITILAPRRTRALSG